MFTFCFRAENQLGSLIVRFILAELVRSLRPIRFIVMALKPRELVQRVVGKLRNLQDEGVRRSPVLIERGGEGGRGSQGMRGELRRILVAELEETHLTGGIFFP